MCSSKIGIPNCLILNNNFTLNKNEDGKFKTIVFENFKINKFNLDKK